MSVKNTYKNNEWEWSPLLLAYCVLNCKVESVQYFVLSNRFLVLITWNWKTIVASEASAQKLSEGCHIISNVSCWQLHICNVNIEVCIRNKFYNSLCHLYWTVNYKHIHILQRCLIVSNLQIPFSLMDIISFEWTCRKSAVSVCNKFWWFIPTVTPHISNL